MRNLYPTLLILFTLNAFGDCPRADLKETAADCPWGEIARTMVVTEMPTEKALSLYAPTIKKMLEKDSKDEVLKKAWGLSINYDELVKDTIVAPATLDVLLKWGKVAPRADQIAHAGIEHTYGYLLSNLLTSFGYKRSRWVSGTIENGFGLPTGTFSPSAKDGTLLGNVTGFLTTLTGRAEKSKPYRSKLVAKAVSQFPYDKLSVFRLAESVQVTPQRKVEIRTDLVEFLKKPTESDGSTHLLIYSYWDSEISSSKLITTFPVGQSFVTSLVEASKEKRPMKTRYNAFIPGVTDGKENPESQPEAKAL